MEAPQSGRPFSTHALYIYYIHFWMVPILILREKKDRSGSNAEFCCRRRKGGRKWWAVAESNCGHEAFQASALPTELTARDHNYNNSPSSLSSRRMEVLFRDLTGELPLSKLMGRVYDWI